MQKDFNKWNDLKKSLEISNSEVFANRREVWWSHLGINLGSEVCGKNNPFERPVLVLKVFTKTLLLIVPLSTQDKNTPNHIKIKTDSVVSYAMVEHIKVISTKRLSRKIARLDKKTFDEIYEKVKRLL